MNSTVIDPSSGVHSGRTLALLALIAITLTGVVFGLTSTIGIDLADEGFLWHGSQLTALGQMPVRDFQAYDPGRYYWSAAWSELFGTGLLALRLSNAIFQALGLFCGLAILRRLTSSIPMVTLLGVLLVVWMFPRHKLFETSLSLMAVLFAVRLLERPTVRRHLVAGVFVGLAAFFGRNHGLYCALGFAAVILFAHRDQSESPLPGKLAGWAAGVALGYTPMLALLAFAPGMWDAFLESMRLLGTRGTNVPRAIPWPWTLDYGLPAAALLPDLAAGVGYVAMLIVYPAGLIWVVSRKGRSTETQTARAVLIAAVCIGLPYAHHSWVRASPSHLAQSIQPLLLAACALPCIVSGPRRAPTTAVTWALLSIGALIVAWGVHPELRTYGAFSRPTVVEHQVAGDTIEIPQKRATILEQLETVIADRVPPTDRVFMAPFRVAYYPILDKVATTWDLYMLWDASEEHQRAIAEELEQHGIDWVLIVDEFLLNQPETAFTNTHRSLMRHFRRKFDPVLDPRLPDGHILLQRR